MKNYPYSLEKYTGIGTRYRCPNCGDKKSFVRYVDSATGQHIADHVGKCNHESSCGYHLTPKQYFLSNNIGYNHYVPTKKQTKQPEIKPDFIPEEFVRKTQSFKNNFFDFLTQYFSTDAIKEVAKKYLIGSTKSGETVFYQIDINGNTRTGKIIKYDPRTGKRSKKMDWVHSRLMRLSLIKNGFHLKQCLFGEHLLKQYPNMDVALVEGEKNAVCGVLIDPNKLWLAVGSKQELKPDKLLPLKGRNIILYPDTDATEAWEAKANGLQFMGFNIKISKIVSSKATNHQKQKGYDFFDFIIDELIGTASQ